MKNITPLAFAITLAAASSIAFQTYANEESIVWIDKEVNIQDFDCAKDGHKQIIISGTVTLNRSDDFDTATEAKKIRVNCPRIVFNDDAVIQSFSELIINADSMTGKTITLRSTRGKDAGKPDPTPELWVSKRAPNGVHGQRGNPHEEKENGFLCNDGINGGRGDYGQHGHDGKNGQEGASGKQGSGGSRITLSVGTFETGEEIIQIFSLGGSGGRGGKGGTGFDGGIGGNGGRGGTGGDAECGHAGAHGGQGGNGGNGGRGGNGGAGGDGGHGGVGGDVTFGLLEGGKKPKEYFFYTDGGDGGEPGLGGDPGIGGQGGKGGSGGKAGQGWFKDGKKAKPGKLGITGEDGIPGPLGSAGLGGPLGQNGGSGTWESGPITPEVLNLLKKFKIS